MASISKDGGASFNEHELSDAEFPPSTWESVIASRPTLGKVDKPFQDHGTDFSTSSVNANRSKPNVNPFLPSPAPMMENHSSQAPEESSIVDSTDGNGQETEPPRSGSDSNDLGNEELETLLLVDEDEDESEPAPKPTPRRTPSKKATPVKKSAPRSRATVIGDDDFDEFD